MWVWSNSKIYVWRVIYPMRCVCRRLQLSLFVVVVIRGLLGLTCKLLLILLSKRFYSCYLSFKSCIYSCNYNCKMRWWCNLSCYFSRWCMYKSLWRCNFLVKLLLVGVGDLGPTIIINKFRAAPLWRRWDFRAAPPKFIN